MAYLSNSRNVFFRRIIFPTNTLFKSQIRLFADDDVERGSIKVKNNNPFDLYKEWYNEAHQKLIRPMALTFILSNYSPERKVQSRMMMYLEQKDDKFTIFGSDKTHKIQDIKKHPDVAMCFVWSYMRDNYFVLRQVRVTGKATEISKDQMSRLFDKLNVPLKIEWTLSKQNEVVENWKEKQEKYKALAKKIKTVPMPPYITGFTVAVNEIQFLHNVMKTTPFLLADRVLFKKDGGKWTYTHIGA